MTRRAPPYQLAVGALRVIRMEIGGFLASQLLSTESLSGRNFAIFDTVQKNLYIHMRSKRKYILWPDSLYHFASVLPNN